MSGPVTVDASVWVSAFTPSEPAYAKSHTFIQRLRKQNRAVFLPTLALVEIAAAIGRGQNQPQLGIAFAREISRLPQVTLVSLDPLLAQEAAEIAARYRLRGSDAVYVAVARRFGTVLVTLDKEQKQRASAVVRLLYPGKRV